MYDAISGISHAYFTNLVTTMRKWEYYSIIEYIYIYPYICVCIEYSSI